MGINIMRGYKYPRMRHFDATNLTPDIFTLRTSWRKLLIETT